jgi:uroporphyrinogen III methyltransferase/synthase
VEQGEINRILLEKAKEGKNVLRLKGGDPFVFGRGGEELELLVQEGIPFEIVPGVTSAAAVPAYAGIPLTHRDYASSFHVVTGHPRRDGVSRIDYPALVKMGGTLVFLMGLSKLEEICRGLLRAGMGADTPAAVLERGTDARQRSIVSDVEHLPLRAREACVVSPAIIVVGEVCSLSSEFCWVEKQVFGGRQFVVTRPEGRGENLARRLRTLGARVLEVPAIETVPIQPNVAFSENVEKFARREGEAWLVFTSPIGVRTFFAKMMEQGMDMRDIFRRKAEVKLAVIGSATRDALKEFGLMADLMPPIYDSENLGKTLARTATAGSEILVARAAEGSKFLLPPLETAGHKVTDLALYETRLPRHGWCRETVFAAFKAGEVDGVIFTSASTVRGFAAEFLPGQACAPLEILRETLQQTSRGELAGDFMRAGTGVSPDMVTAFCIGEQTAREARKFGMEALVAKEATMDALVDLVCERFGGAS